MVEIDLVGTWDRDLIVLAGLIGMKTHYSETPDDIIERVRAACSTATPSG